jgi:hypothetical protein
MIVPPQETELEFPDFMRFSHPEYSRAEVDWAGEILISDPGVQPFEAWEKAFAIIGNWRSSHSFPLRTIRYGIYHKAKKIDHNSITVQRLKRIYSIDLKLRRFRNLRLSEIQDIGGCRAVVQTVAEVKKLVNAYKNSEIRHELDDEDDYVTNPKKSGYRSHHLIYRYQSDKNDVYNNLKIEIQIRSKLQHAWATAVETVGGFTGQALKSSQGERDWLRFFTLMGTVIAMREGTPACPNTPQSREELKGGLREYAKKLNVENRLEIYGVAVQATREEHAKDASFFLLLLDVKNHSLEIRPYGADELKEAQEEYTKIETKYPQKEGRDVVLVSGDSIKEIKQAYPNYFLDTTLFLNVLKRAIA